MHEITDALGTILGKFAYGVDSFFTRVNDRFNEVYDGLKNGKGEQKKPENGIEAIPITEDEDTSDVVTEVSMTEIPPETRLEKYGPAVLGVVVLAASLVGLFAVGSLATGASITAAAGEILLCMIS